MSSLNLISCFTTSQVTCLVSSQLSILHRGNLTSVRAFTTHSIGQLIFDTPGCLKLQALAIIKTQSHPFQWRNWICATSESWCVQARGDYMEGFHSFTAVKLIREHLDSMHHAWCEKPAWLCVSYRWMDSIGLSYSIECHMIHTSTSLAEGIYLWIPILAMWGLLLWMLRSPHAFPLLSFTFMGLCS